MVGNEINNKPIHKIAKLQNSPYAAAATVPNFSILGMQISERKERGK
jgi:hypothetical protein